MSGLSDWRARRLAEVTGPDGWLAVVGQTLLAPGPNEVEEVGTVILEDGLARLGDQVLRPEATVPLAGRSLQLVERAGRFALRVRDPEAPARRDFPGLRCFAEEPVWRRAAKLVAEGAGTITTVFSIGTTGPVPSPGSVEVALPAGSVRLRALRMGGRLLIVFGDATNGHETYGGGRFLWVDEPVEEVDFNQAENPACVFTAYAACPLPLSQNRLAQRVEAGEQYPYPIR